eukprot:jgi/Chlat1/8947/Chrsp94S08254
MAATSVGTSSSPCVCGAVSGDVFVSAFKGRPVRKQKDASGGHLRAHSLESEATRHRGHAVCAAVSDRPSSSQQQQQQQSSRADREDEPFLGDAYTYDDDDEEEEEASTPDKGKKTTRSMRRQDRMENKWQIPESQLPKVAIVGRPNVGKSALFNRIVGASEAIVFDEPGVTRDRLYRRAHWNGREFLLIDTGGLVTPEDAASLGIGSEVGNAGEDAQKAAAKAAQAAGLPALIEWQAASAVGEADHVVLVVDGQAGVTAADLDIASWLRKSYKHLTVTLAVNKCESPTRGELQAAEFWRLGLQPIPVSALSGTGTGELLDQLATNLPDIPEDVELDAPAEDEPLSIAIVGRPNTGKSSILNSLVGEPRSIVSEISGTTRDAIDTMYTSPSGQRYCLIDTAGIRRRTSVWAGKSGAEKLSVERSFRAMQRADVIVLVLEALDCSTEQDYKLAEKIVAEGRACIIVVNKWDTVPEKTSKTQKEYEQDLRVKLRNLHWAEIVYTSATSGLRVPKILEAAERAAEQHRRRVPTATINFVVQDALAIKQPPSRSNRKGKIYYCTQAAIRPPTFVFFTNSAELFSDTYRRFVERHFRQSIGLDGTPIRLFWRSKEKSVNRDPKKMPKKEAAASASA